MTPPNGEGWIGLAKETARQAPSLLIFCVAIYFILDLFIAQAGQLTLAIGKVNDSIAANTATMGVQTEVLRAQAEALKQVQEFQVRAFKEAEADRAKILREMSR